MTFQPIRTLPRETREPLIVKPREGYLVRHPVDGRPIPPEGRDVSAERGYFHRRLRVGDVVRVTQKGKD
jgi:Protein of unknown function (DUF2635)